MEEAYKAVRRCGQQQKHDPQIKRNVEYAQKIIETVIASRLPKGQSVSINRLNAHCGQHYIVIAFRQYRSTHRAKLHPL